MIGGTGSSRSGSLQSSISTISNSASLRFFRSSCTHFATTAAFRPGRVLPTMIPTFIICFSPFLCGPNVTDGTHSVITIVFLPCSLVRGSHFLGAESFGRQQSELLNGSIELSLLLLGQGGHERLKVLCMTLEARYRQALSFGSQVNDPRSSISWAQL